MSCFAGAFRSAHVTLREVHATLMKHGADTDPIDMGRRAPCPRVFRRQRPDRGGPDDTQAPDRNRQVARARDGIRGPRTLARDDRRPSDVGSIAATSNGLKRRAPSFVRASRCCDGGKGLCCTRKQTVANLCKLLQSRRSRIAQDALYRPHVRNLGDAESVFRASPRAARNGLTHDGWARVTKSVEGTSSARTYARAKFVAGFEAWPPQSRLGPVLDAPVFSWTRCPAE
jgi:hypothetical protein